MYKGFKKILILNVGWSNKGNVALVKSTMDAINTFNPDSKFYLMGKEGNTHFDDLNVKEQVSLGLSVRKPVYTFGSLFYLLECSLFFLFRKLNYNLPISKNSKLYDYSTADVVVNSGGDTLSGENNFGSSDILFNILYGILLGKPTVLYGESLGYFDSAIMNSFFKLVVNQTNLILVREELSKRQLDAMGVTKPKICLTADPAFNLKKTSKEDVYDILDKEGIKTIEKPIITINPSGLISRFIGNGDSLGKMRFYEILAEIIDDLVERLNVNVILLPHVYTPGLDDRKAIDLIFNKIKNKSDVHTIKGEYNPEDLKGIIRLSDLFIGMRMHSMIAATSQCVPTVAIAYSHKTRGIIGKMLEMEEYVLDINNLDYETLISKINNAWNNREEIRKEFEKKIPEIKNKAMCNGKLVAEFLVD